MKKKTPLIWCLAGPTAAGKSGLCESIAQYLPVEIINVDSATIYRTMDIGTAKPGAREQQALKHHLLDILDPSQSYSVARFCEDAQRLIREIQSRDHIPLLVGGTMMYFNALQKGLSDLPGAHPEVRAEIEQQALTQGWPAMHQTLAGIDPVTAARLAPNDSQRIARALEVHTITGQPLSSLIGAGTASQAMPNLRMISLEPSDRGALHRRIEQRFDSMLEQGFLQEVERLHARGDLHQDLPSIRCVGYRQLWDVVAQGESIEHAREKAIIATRQLAKRQLTWLRSMPDRIAVDCLSQDMRDTVRKILQHSFEQG